MITVQYQSPIGVITLVSDGNSLTELLLAQPLIQDTSNRSEEHTSELQSRE